MDNTATLAGPSVSPPTLVDQVPSTNTPTGKLGDIPEGGIEITATASILPSSTLSSPLLLSSPPSSDPTISTPLPNLIKKQSYSRLPRRVSQLGLNGVTSPKSEPTPPSPTRITNGFNGHGSPGGISDMDIDRIREENRQLRQSLASSKSYIDNLESSLRTFACTPIRPVINLNHEQDSPISSHLSVQGAADHLGLGLPHSKPMFDLKQKISGGNLRGKYRAHGVQEEVSAENGLLEGMNGDDSGYEDIVKTPQRGQVLRRYGALEEGAFSSPAKGELSRIPMSHVSSSVALHTASHPPPSSLSFLDSRSPSPSGSPAGGANSSPGMLRPGSKARKVSSSSRVIDETKQENDGLRAMTERMRSELTVQKKLVASLQTANEDLKSTRERNRAEIDSLNNVIARKERLLQEVLERARAAELSDQTQKKERKALDTAHKKTMSDLTNRLAEAEILGSRSEREMIALRDSLKSMKEAWKREAKNLRSETKQYVELMRKEKEQACIKHTELVNLVQSQTANRKVVTDLEEKHKALNQQLVDALQPQLKEVRSLLEKENTDVQTSTEMASQLQEEMNRLKRLMAGPQSNSPEPEHD